MFLYYTLLFMFIDTSISFSQSHLAKYRRAEGENNAESKKSLTILPFGDSITSGFASSDGNGYRLTLLEKLSVHHEVTYLGSCQSGNMSDNRHEGHPGYDIERIQQEGMPNFDEKADVILLMAGTNNILQNRSMEDAPQLLAFLLDVVVKSAPTSVVLVATLPYLRHPLWEGRRPLFNDALPDIVSSHANQGRRVALVEMDAVGRDLIDDYDLVHPTDEGYKVVALQWYAAILAAEGRGWLRSDVNNEPPQEGLWADELEGDDSKILPPVQEHNIIEAAVAGAKQEPGVLGSVNDEFAKEKNEGQEAKSAIIQDSDSKEGTQGFLQANAAYVLPQLEMFSYVIFISLLLLGIMKYRRRWYYRRA